MPQKAGRQELDRRRAPRGTDSGPEDPGQQGPQRHEALAGVVDRGGETAETALEFVGAQGHMGWQSRCQERRQGDQPTAAGNGIDKSRQQAGQPQK